LEIFQPLRDSNVAVLEDDHIPSEDVLGTGDAPPR
jgi:hypothetical protein